MGVNDGGARVPRIWIGGRERQLSLPDVVVFVEFPASDCLRYGRCSEMCLWLHVSLRDVDKLVSTELDAAEISEIQCLFPAAMARTQCNVEISPKHATFSDRSFTSSTIISVYGFVFF